jgi:hypothetical protein
MITRLVLLACVATLAAVEPVSVRVGQPSAWAGQRVPFFIELRAPGSFAGAAAFDLPEIPGCLVVKVGNPVVASEEADGRSWFVQTHEFALFAQPAGRLSVPAGSVRFAHREGFDGPAREVRRPIPAWEVAIRRPEGVEARSFLVTTDALDISETWDPQPGPVEAGAVFHRTVVQRAAQVAGMALAPLPTAAPDGVRVHAAPAATADKLERGDFLGERRETLTYVLQRPGQVELPAITLAWWDPARQQAGSRTLPAVTIEVRAAQAPSTTTWDAILVAVVALSLAGWLLPGWMRRLWRRLHPPQRVAARALLRACRRDDAPAALAAWAAWERLQPQAALPPALAEALHGLYRHTYAPGQDGAWHGTALAQAFRTQPAASLHPRPSPLPGLNP